MVYPSGALMAEFADSARDSVSAGDSDGLWKVNHVLSLTHHFFILSVIVFNEKYLLFSLFIASFKT